MGAHKHISLPQRYPILNLLKVVHSALSHHSASVLSCCIDSKSTLLSPQLKLLGRHAAVLDYRPPFPILHVEGWPSLSTVRLASPSKFTALSR